MIGTPRRTQTIEGVLHCQCAKCQQMFPADRDHFYFQIDRRVSPEPRPHSWCRWCYLANQAQTATSFAQKSFLNLAPPRDVDRFTGCALLAA